MPDVDDFEGVAVIVKANAVVAEAQEELGRIDALRQPDISFFGRARGTRLFARNRRKVPELVCLSGMSILVSSLIHGSISQMRFACCRTGARDASVSTGSSGCMKDRLLHRSFLAQ